ncbi:MAG: hypothetical protein V1934_05580 [Methanobacteriota archaeon]
MADDEKEQKEVKMKPDETNVSRVVVISSVKKSDEVRELGEK